MIIIFGLENVLVIVKAVVSTRGNKDVKLKIAEGTHTTKCIEEVLFAVHEFNWFAVSSVALLFSVALKQEGVAITINFVTILVLLVLGCFVFSTAMQVS